MKTCLSLIAVFFCIYSNCQNLVPNPSFETRSGGPVPINEDSGFQKGYVQSWTNATGSPDLAATNGSVTTLCMMNTSTSGCWGGCMPNHHGYGCCDAGFDRSLWN